MKKAAIIGATGFGGLGLIQLLLNHPHIEINGLCARKDTGKDISEVFPSLSGYLSQKIIETENLNLNDIDIIFLSTPDRAGMQIIKQFADYNIPVIDFSGDFRFNTAEEYSIYAQNKNIDTDHLSSHLLEKSIYGLPEKYRDRIKNSKIIGNPGCFAISMILGLLPAAESGIIKSGTIISDGKSGVSGAGKNPGEANFYPQRYENINTYREGHHQHTVEVENIINKFSPSEHKLLFIPQVIPMSRGILSTMYFQPSQTLDTVKLFDIYNRFYQNEKFIEVTKKSPGTAEVRGTNKCKIKPYYDSRTGMCVIISVIDNLMKGQSGNAIQVANIILGFDETCGLNQTVQFP